MSLNNTVIFVFMTILNVLLCAGLSMLSRLMWTEDERFLSIMVACLAVTAFLFLEYLLVGGLIK